MTARGTAISQYNPSTYTTPVIKLGNSEITAELLDELAETAGFIKFLREHDRKWEELYAAYKVTKRLEGT